jgi:hypothetical protein
MSEPDDESGCVREIEAKPACILTRGREINAHLTQPKRSGRRCDNNGFAG